MDPEIHRSWWRHKSQGNQDKVRSLESFLSVLGPEKTAAKVQIQEALRRVQEVSQPVRPQQNTIQAEAVAKVERLQRASDALGELGGPEVEAIKKALKKAQEVSREQPIAEVVKECEDFIKRSFREFESETGLLEEGRIRLTRLNAQQATSVLEPVALCGPSSTLIQMVIQLQLERDSLSKELRRSRASKGRSWCDDGPPDVSEVPPMPDRFQDLQDWLSLWNWELRDVLEFDSSNVMGATFLRCKQ